MKPVVLLTFLSALSFLFFGIACFTAPKMKTEFLRYRLAPYRRIVGVLQLVGALGLILGYLYAPVLQAIAAGGLAVLMVLGFLVRLRIRDSFMQAAPSFLFAVLNAFVCLKLLQTLI